MPQAHPRRPAIRFSIVQIMVVVAACCLLLAVARDPQVGELFVRAVFFVFLPLALIRLAIQAIHAAECPACGERALRRVTIRAFGNRYYQCGHCRARVKRQPLGIWRDASGSADATFFRRRHGGDPWGNGPVIASGDAGYAGVPGALLRSKRERETASPSFPIDIAEEPAGRPGVS